MTLKLPSSYNMSVRLPPDLHGQVKSRKGDLTWTYIVTRDLDRLYNLHRDTLAILRLTEAEARLITEALKDLVHTDALSVSLLWAHIDNHVRIFGPEEGAALVEKARDFTPAENLAVADAAERFWSMSELRRENPRNLRLCFGIEE